MRGGASSVDCSRKIDANGHFPTNVCDVYWNPAGHFASLGADDITRINPYTSESTQQSKHRTMTRESPLTKANTILWPGKERYAHASLAQVSVASTYVEEGSEKVQRLTLFTLNPKRKCRSGCNRLRQNSKGIIKNRTITLLQPHINSNAGTTSPTTFICNSGFQGKQFFHH